MLIGLKAYRPDISLLVPAVAVYGNHVPHAIFPSSDDNFSETHVHDTASRIGARNCSMKKDEERHKFSSGILWSVEVQCKSPNAIVCQGDSWFGLK